jgi:phosphoketolase
VTDDELRGLDAYWRAANYLSVGQIYLLDNPLLRGPLRPEHVKPRLLGHWGTTPGLNFLYTHLDRAIRERHLDAIFVCGPGHGGPAVVAHAYLEGTYSELYPHVSQDEAGLRELFRQFSFPGGIPSHAGAGDTRLDPRGRRARLRARQEMEDARLRARAYGREHGEDDPNIVGWSREPQAAETP